MPFFSPPPRQAYTCRRCGRETFSLPYPRRPPLPRRRTTSEGTAPGATRDRFGDAFMPRIALCCQPTSRLDPTTLSQHRSASLSPPRSGSVQRYPDDLRGAKRTVKSIPLLSVLYLREPWMTRRHLRQKPKKATRIPNSKSRIHLTQTTNS